MFALFSYHLIYTESTNRAKRLLSIITFVEVPSEAPVLPASEPRDKNMGSGPDAQRKRSSDHSYGFTKKRTSHRSDGEQKVWAPTAVEGAGTWTSRLYLSEPAMDVASSRLTLLVELLLPKRKKLGLDPKVLPSLLQIAIGGSIKYARDTGLAAPQAAEESRRYASASRVILHWAS